MFLPFKATGPVDESDGQTIISAVEAFESTIVSALNTIVTEKAAFQALPIGGIPALVLQDLQTLNTDTTAFENALIASAPVSPSGFSWFEFVITDDSVLQADLVSQAQSISSSINAAFAAAIAAYS